MIFILSFNLQDLSLNFINSIINQSEFLHKTLINTNRVIYLYIITLAVNPKINKANKFFKKILLIFLYIKINLKNLLFVN